MTFLGVVHPIMTYFDKICTYLAWHTTYVVSKLATPFLNVVHALLLSWSRLEYHPRKQLQTCPSTP
jgi:hypothetical protein